MCAAAGGVYYWQQSVAKKQQAELQSQIDSLKRQVADTEKKVKETEAKSPSTQAVSTKTYSNSKYGISLQYPSSYLTSETENGIYFSKSTAEKKALDACLAQHECMQINYGIHFEKESLQGKTLQAYAKDPSEDPTPSSSITIDGRQAINSEYTAGEVTINVTYVQVGSNVLKIQSQTRSNDDLAGYKNNIMASFKIK